MISSHSGRTPIWMLGILLFVLSYTSMFSDISLPNERSRAYMAIAIVEHHTLSIDEPLKRFGRIGDRAIFEGRHFSDKAPGTGFLGSVSFAMAKLLFGDEPWSITDVIRLLRRSISLPFALLGFIWIRRLLAHLKMRDDAVEWTSWSWLLGTAAFHYSGAYFGHQIAASALVGSFWYLNKAITFGSKPLLIASGLLSGLAVLTEYPAAIGVVSIAFYALLNLKKLRTDILIWCLAGVPFAILLGWYHTSCFGDPLSFPYQHLAAATYRKIHGAGLAGVTTPEFDAFELWFLSFRRGLLAGSPFYPIAFIGFIELWKTNKAACLSCFSLAFCVFWFASSAHIWGGDWGFGPRIIVFSLGLLIIPVTAGLARLARNPLLYSLGIGLMIYSIMVQQWIHFIFPEPWAKFTNPIADLTTYVKGGWDLSPNLSSLYLNVDGWPSAVPLCAALGLVVTHLIRRSQPPNRLMRYVPLMIAVLLFTAAASISDTPPKTFEQWRELINLWASKESDYH